VSWDTLEPAVRAIAERELTAKQLEVFRRECDNWGTMRIARYFSLTRSSVKDRLHNAHTKLEHHGVQQDASGKWCVSEEVAA
jgi:DNA-binding CsgD family transcriptional regulator